MKRITNKIILATIMVFALCGCTKYIDSNDTPTDVIDESIINYNSNVEIESTTSVEERIQKRLEIRKDFNEISYPEQAQMDDGDLNSIQRVLFNLDDFIDTGDNTCKRIEDLGGFFWVDEYVVPRYYIEYFWYMDIDGDGSREVIACCGLGDKYIFSEIDGQIYASKLTKSGIDELYTDGVYLGTGSWARYCRVTDITTEGIKEELILSYAIERDGSRIYSLEWEKYEGRVISIPVEEGENIIAGISTAFEPIYQFNRYNVEMILADWGHSIK